MNKKDFLMNVSIRLRRTSDEPPSARTSIGAPAFWVEREQQPADLTRRFVDSFRAHGGEIELFSTDDHLRCGLDEHLHTLSPQVVGAWGLTADWPVDVEGVLAAWNTVRWDQSRSEAFARVQVSVTGCKWGIADTGTVVMESSHTQGRGAHMLPTVHIVLMRETQIRLRLGEALSSLTEQNKQSGLPASVHFVSGPSRSSDIENDQSIGVHGPARVIILLCK